MKRFYAQWATVCWQVRDSETHRAVAFYKSEAQAKADVKKRNGELG